MKFELTETFVKEWNRIRNKLDRMRGPGVVNKPDSISIGRSNVSGASDESEGEMARVKISGPITGQIGRYNAKIFKDPIVVAATGDLAESDLGELSSDEAIVWCLSDGGVVAGDILIGQRAGTTKDGKAIIVVQSVWTTWVTVTQSGGSAGNGTTQVSFTYDFTPAGRPAQTGIAVDNPRVAKLGKCVAGTFGLAYWNGSVWKLRWVNEGIDPKACT